MKNRIIRLVSVLALCSPFSTPQNANKSATDFRDIFVPMRDGVHLATDVFLPASTGHWPTILIRTPYSRHGLSIRGYHSFVQHGYALVVQDLRGRYASQGIFSPISQEGPDGDDTINWIAIQPWSNGRVAMVGNSYQGLVQWWAAVEGNSHLRAISPMSSGDDEYSDRYYSSGGALQLGHRLLWFAENFPVMPAGIAAPLSTYINHLPLRTSDVAATQKTLPLWQSALNHPSFDNFWQQQSLRNFINRVKAPVLSIGGWFDSYAADDLDAFDRLAKANKTVETWIGPWAHNPGLRFPTRDFGPEAIVSLRSKQNDWFDRWLKKPSAASPDNESTLHIFVMGPDIWRKEHEWPLARTHYTPLYLASAGHANTSAGDGALTWQLPRKSRTDSFTYDPHNPVPSMGGAVCCDPTVFPPGPLDQSTVETRQDVLVFTSPPLADEIEVTGPVRTILYVSTSVNDTDFTAKLVDVQPNGKPLLVTDGIQRLRYRLSLSTPVYVKRNQEYQISVDTGVTSYVFAPGHKIRLEVSSSNYPRFDRNLNLPGSLADQSKMIKAHQTVFHQKGYPSSIVLPVIAHARNGGQH